jgi:GNAT superfamily N-acetyltransferase
MIPRGLNEAPLCKRFLQRKSPLIQWPDLLQNLEVCPGGNGLEAGQARWQYRTMEVRDATPADALGGCTVLKRSIAELCDADHKNDPAVLARWLGNKTVENFVAWVGQLDNSLLVAVENNNILAVGAVTDAGVIGLNYVSPDARFRGVSRAMLQALEARAFERGNTRCTLTSTETARRFYRSNGYLEDGAPVGNFGASSGSPMSKRLVAQKS